MAGKAGTTQGQQQQKTTAPTAGATVKEEFGSTELSVTAETNSSALASRAQALVQAAFVMAERHPRDWDEVRIKLLKECKRQGFARTARYRKPVGRGEKVEGPSIRFAEAALATMTNIKVDNIILRDDQLRRVVEVVILDLERNVHFTRQVTIDKTVERSSVPDGETPISVRQNSYGRNTYLLAATEDSLANKQAAAVSKALRTEGLRLLPGDILEECMAQCIATQKAADQADPDKARKEICDAFAELNVTPVMLKTYLGHDVATISPAELQELREIYAAIRDGETSWNAVINDGKDDGPAPGVQAPKAPAAPPPAEAPAAPTASTTTSTTAQPGPTQHPPSQATVDAPATPAPAPAAVPPAEPTPSAAAEPTPAPADDLPADMLPAEKEIAHKLASATNRKEVFALVKLINALPAERQPFWRGKFNQRAADLKS